MDGAAGAAVAAFAAGFDPALNARRGSIRVSPVLTPVGVLDHDGGLATVEHDVISVLRRPDAVVTAAFLCRA